MCGDNHPTRVVVNHEQLIAHKSTAHGWDKAQSHPPLVGLYLRKERIFILTPARSLLQCSEAPQAMISLVSRLKTAYTGGTSV